MAYNKGMNTTTGTDTTTKYRALKVKVGTHRKARILAAFLDIEISELLEMAMDKIAAENPEALTYQMKEPG